MENLPKIDLDDYEIRDTLNEHGGVTDNVLVSKFRAKARTNKWAKYKPVSYPKPFVLSEQELKQSNYGLSSDYIGRSITPQDLMTEAMKGTDFYPYILPQGGERSPFRMADFRGYNPDAEPPYIMQCYDTAEFVSFPAEIVYNLRENSSVNSEIKISDLAAFEDNVALTGKIGVLWTAGDSLYYLYYAPSANIATGISLNIDVQKPGTYHFLAVWFETNVSAGNNEVTGEAINFTPIPDSYQKVVVTQKIVYALLSVDWALNNLYYDSASGYVRGFSYDHPRFSVSFPNGEPPACIYKLGLHFTATVGGDEYQGEYWYDGEYIEYRQAAVTSTIINFPSELNLLDILMIPLDGRKVQNIRMMLDIQKVSGNGFLQLSNEDEYKIPIY
jgi:hypothetical protein